MDTRVLVVNVVSGRCVSVTVHAVLGAGRAFRVRDHASGGGDTQGYDAQARAVGLNCTWEAQIGIVRKAFGRAQRPGKRWYSFGVKLADSPAKVLEMDPFLS